MIFFLTILCLLYGLPLGPSSLLRHHLLHAQTLRILADWLDLVHDSYLITYVTHTTTDTSSIRTMTRSSYA
jgi:hypothetical protein